MSSIFGLVLATSITSNITLGWKGLLEITTGLLSAIIKCCFTKFLLHFTPTGLTVEMLHEQLEKYKKIS
jgi:hydroxymethylpyrimidine/phosphomethylpyrimidine kinase